VPHEVKVLMEEQVLPKISLRFTMPVIYHKMIRTAGIPESKLAEVIREWESELPMHIRLAYLPKLAQVRLRLTAFGDDLDALKREVEEQIDKVMPDISKYAYGYDTDELEVVIGNLLLEKGYTIATAESCTGGYIAHQITSVAGSSAYYLGSIIPYHNQFKQNLLGVNAETLRKFGAVSEECVKEMAENVRKKFGADIGLATSGIAGPTGGTAEKPIGTVWVAVATPSGISSRLLRLTKERGLNIQLTGTATLYMIWRTLVEMS
jgi:nicotinamide-nucleotide amidase